MAVVVSGAGVVGEPVPLRECFDGFQRAIVDLRKNLGPDDSARVAAGDRRVGPPVSGLAFIVGEGGGTVALMAVDDQFGSLILRQFITED